MRLKMAPGRRSTSMISLRRTADDPRDELKQRHHCVLPRSRRPRGPCVAGRPRRRRLAAVDELREDFVERRPVFARRDDVAAGRRNRVDECRDRITGIVGDDPDIPRARLTDGSDRPAAFSRTVPSNARVVSISTTSPPIAERRSSSGGASAMSRPSAISATWSHSSASLTYCVVTRSVRPSARSRWSSSQIDFRRSGSIPAVGSSRNSSAGSCTRAHASSSRRCIPPDSSLARRLRASHRSTSSSTSRTRRVGDARACRTGSRRSRRSPGPSGRGRARTAAACSRSARGSGDGNGAGSRPGRAPARRSARDRRSSGGSSSSCRPRSAR